MAYNQSDSVKVHKGRAVSLLSLLGMHPTKAFSF